MSFFSLGSTLIYSEEFEYEDLEDEGDEEEANPDCPAVRDPPVAWLRPNNTYANGEFRRYCQNLTKIPDDMPGDALMMRLSGNFITVVPPNAFSHLTICKYISLSWNDVHTIHFGAFNNLSALEKLYIHDNNLTELYAREFEELESLFLLNVMHNQIQRIQVGSFDGLVSLRELYIHDNWLLQLESGTFRDLPLVGPQLNLMNNRLRRIDAGSFEGLDAVENLYLHDSNLTELVPGTFTGLYNVTLIHAARNQLKLIHVGAFDSIPTLEFLYIQENNLTILEKGYGA